MVTKTTRWSPDTCGCILEYTWDNSSSLESRTHTFSRLVKSCPEHSDLPTETDVYNTVKDENTKKNKTLTIVLNHPDAPSTLYDIRKEDGAKLLKETINYRWQWTQTSPNRKLNIEFVDNTTDSKISITDQTKTNIETTLDTEFGSGKVVLL